MASPEAQIERTEEVFKAFAEKGQEWVPFKDLALKATAEEQQRRRDQRSRALNSLRDFLCLDNPPKKPSFASKRQTSAAVHSLESQGLVQARSVEAEDSVYPEIVYRLVPDHHYPNAAAKDRLMNDALSTTG